MNWLAFVSAVVVAALGGGVATWFLVPAQRRLSDADAAAKLSEAALKLLAPANEEIDRLNKRLRTADESIERLTAHLRTTEAEMNGLLQQVDRAKKDLDVALEENRRLREPHPPM